MVVDSVLTCNAIAAHTRIGRLTRPLGGPTFAGRSIRMLATAVGAPGTAVGERDLWIDSAADHPKTYTSEQAWLVCWVLTHLAQNEKDPTCREAELHALAEIVEWHPAARSAVTALTNINRVEVSISEQE